MTGGQASVASQLYPLLGGLHDRLADDDQRRRVIGAMRVARWWSIACGRLDEAEVAIAAGGGFDVSIDAAPTFEAFTADLLSYYIFGTMVLERLAAVAVGGDVDGAWNRWLGLQDAGPDSPVRWYSRELDLDLRTVRNKLAVHLGDADGMAWGIAGPGLTTFARLRPVGVPAPEADVADVERVAARLRLTLPPHEDMIERPWTVVDSLRGQARWLDQAGRDTYRHWGTTWGLQSAPLNDLTWKVVELARFLADDPGGGSGR